jgi:Arc/MetJ-type ribon-helix-helix transcriptional regulator
MSQIAVRLTGDELRELDSLVDAGGFRTRAEAVREGIRMLRHEAREKRIVDAYQRAYSTPIDEEDARMLDAAAALAADLPL